MARGRPKTGRQTTKIFPFKASCKVKELQKDTYIKGHALIFHFVTEYLCHIVTIFPSH